MLTKITHLIVSLLYLLEKLNDKISFKKFFKMYTWIIYFSEYIALNLMILFHFE